jgi:hypothetical protein
MQGLNRTCVSVAAPVSVSAPDYVHGTKKFPDFTELYIEMISKIHCIVKSLSTAARDYCEHSDVV